MPTQQQIKQIIVQELPIILQQDTEIKDFVLQLSRRHFADKKKTESRFDRMLDELRRDREEQSRRWDAQEQKWKERQLQNQQRWEEQNHKWEEQNRKWEEHQREDK
ncbi:MAG: hypothetical protein U9R15_15570, partial [Chloroflexota bacterium]|nr:hypothetical protein [Chloroflexota bacterium]